MDITLNYWPGCQICTGCANAIHFTDSSIETGCRASVTLPDVGKIECSKRIDDELPDLSDDLIDLPKIIEE